MSIGTIACLILLAWAVIVFIIGLIIFFKNNDENESEDVVAIGFSSGVIVSFILLLSMGFFSEIETGSIIMLLIGFALTIIATIFAAQAAQKLKN